MEAVISDEGDKRSAESPIGGKSELLDRPDSARRPHVASPAKLFLASFLALYFELVVIRYLSTEVRVFAYLQNLPLIASFLGLGLGMVRGKKGDDARRLFPYVAALLFLLIGFAPSLHLTHLRLPSRDYFVWGTMDIPGGSLFVWAATTQYLLPILAILTLVVVFFAGLGTIVGDYLARLPALRGYGLNLAGSLAGIVGFTLMATFALPPVVWIVVGFLAAIPFFIHGRVALVVFGLAILTAGVPRPGTFWSPYYRVDLYAVPTPPGWGRPAAYALEVNYDYHQKMVDLSPEFTARYPDAEPNRSARSTYDLPYRLVKDPDEVLVVGAGTGNDVAAALRWGAHHIDAVEIDPVILRLGRKDHPERPYDSPRVTAYIDDARASLKKTRKTYNLIVFGYLDSHTLFTSFSSLRLDNYVYTVESFREARSRLKKGGTLVVAFASGKSFVTGRLYDTMSRAFEAPPRGYFTGYDGSGVVFV